MARPRDHQKHISNAVEELLRSVTGLLGAVGAAVATSREVRAAARDVGRTATVTGKKIGAKVKAAWARLTPKQRRARIRKMHAWRKK